MSYHLPEQIQRIFVSVGSGSNDIRSWRIHVKPILSNPKKMQVNQRISVSFAKTAQ